MMYNLSLKNVSRTMYRTFQLPCPLYIVNSCELFRLWGCPLLFGRASTAINVLRCSYWTEYIATQFDWLVYKV